MNDSIWIVGYNTANEAYKYYKYLNHTQEAEFLFTTHPQLETYTLANMYPVVIKSRDGLNLVSYLSIPPDKDNNGTPSEVLPMVLLVHGGPWARDYYGYNAIHQWLANRGYAVLSVNFRGSTGYGKDFINAGIQEWAGKMHNDLIDAVN